jgi:hypothetical protein
MRQRGNILVLGAPTVIALWFIYGFALMYLTTDPGQFGIYWPRHQWLYAHVAAGIVAILSGPIQLWLGLNRHTAIFHQILGIIYVVSVGVSGTCAFYLAKHNDFGWVFGLGFGTMAFVWMISTAIATIAICLRSVEQHREWVIRSYVLTYGFVTFRLTYTVLDIAKKGNTVERMSAAVWLGWTIPLFLTEAILQGRKIFLKPVNAVQPQDANAYNASTGQAAFDLQNSGSSYLHRP